MATNGSANSKGTSEARMSLAVAQAFTTLHQPVIGYGQPSESRRDLGQDMSLWLREIPGTGFS